MELVINFFFFFFRCISVDDVMKRDFLQSVPFKRYKVYSSTKLEAELLVELPNQVHEYSSINFRMK